MIRLLDNGDEVFLEYTPSYMDEMMLAKIGLGLNNDGNLEIYTFANMPQRIRDKRPSLHDALSLKVKHVFTFRQEDLVFPESDSDTLVFKFAKRGLGDYRDYWIIPGRVFDIGQNVLIDDTEKLDWRMFCVGYGRRTSVFRKISKVVDHAEKEIVIGGEAEGAIPIESFTELLDRFPTTTELEHYGEALIEEYIQDYLSTARDFSGKYERRYASKRRRAFESLDLRSSVLDPDRYHTLNKTRAILKELLKKGDKIPEEIWQEGILELLPTLFPQYVSVIPKARVRDMVNGKVRYIDFLLVDATGNVDVLEIKKAFPKNHLIMQCRYRDNCVPAKELSGGIAQIEKYIYYLLNWGSEGEKELTERYTKMLPNGMKLQFINPRGLLLLGHCEFDEGEARDFEIIRRQYKHIADIITYDDLLSRLSRMIDAISDEAASV